VDYQEQKIDIPMYLDFLGFVPRNIRFSKEVELNPYAKKFCLERYGQIPQQRYNQYAMTKCNDEAGFKGFFKYALPEPKFDEAAMLASFDWMTRHFYVHMCESRLLTIEEIVRQMDKTTSPGYPWILIGAKKSEILQEDCFWNYFYDYVSRNRESGRVPVLFLNNVKYELRDVEKLKENKMRVFMGSPIEHVMLTMMLCWYMNDSFYSTAHHHWSFVGATKYKRGIHRLACRIMKYPNVYSLDETSYDATLADRLLFELVNFRWQMLREKDRTLDTYNMMYHVYEEIVDSATVCTTGEVFLKHIGNPSGSANTIVDNTLILYRLLAYAWFMLAPDDLKTQFAFETNVEAALNGDDNLWSVSDLVVKWFNALTVKEVWLKIGIKAHADPDIPENYLPRKFSQCDFLCQNFKQVDRVWVPYPDTQKIMCALFYGGKTQLSVKMALLRAYALRLESYFNDECRKEILEYIRFLKKNYDQQLKSEPVVMKTQVMEPAYQHIENSFFTDSEALQMYLGYESSGSLLDRTLLFRKFCHELYPEGL
jgi:hypothetical protein